MAPKNPQSKSLHDPGKQAIAKDEENTPTTAKAFGGFVTQYNEDGKGNLKVLAGSKIQQPQDQHPKAQKYEYPEPTTWEESYDYKYPYIKPPLAPPRTEYEEQTDSDDSVRSPDTMLARFKRSSPQQPKKTIDLSLIDPRLLEMSDQPTGARTESTQGSKHGDKKNKAIGNNADTNADNARTCD
ncbi:hypothetical protein BKA81DRAFT_403175 [Phyllosticta paracitricarpa]